MTVRRVCRRVVVVAAAWLIAGGGMLRSADGRLNFVSCPIVRDTSSVPCWLSEHEGELYFLTIQSDVSAPVTPPWLGHRVLVEGSISKEPRICGGVVLKPVHLSVLPQRDESCNTMLPAEEQYNLTFEPPRPPGPSKGRLAFDGALDDLKDSVKRLHVTAREALPADFDVPGRLRREVAGHEALVTVRLSTPELLESVERSHGAKVRVEDLSLEDIFLEMSDA